MFVTFYDTIIIHNLYSGGTKCGQRPMVFPFRFGLPFEFCTLLDVGLPYANETRPLFIAMQLLVLHFVSNMHLDTKLGNL